MDLGERLTRLLTKCNECNYINHIFPNYSYLKKVLSVQQMAFIAIFNLAADQIMQQNCFDKGTKCYSFDVSFDLAVPFDHKIPLDRLFRLMVDHFVKSYKMKSSPRMLAGFSLNSNYQLDAIFIRSTHYSMINDGQDHPFLIVISLGLLVDLCTCQ